MSFGKFKLVLCAILLACISATQAKSQTDLITQDLSNVPPELAEVLLEAEAAWEERLIGYSTELPDAILQQLTTIQITSLLMPLDGPGGTLAVAGPTQVLTYEPPLGANNQNTSAVALAGTAIFDSDDSFPATAREREILVAVAIHEFGHAMGFGTLWQFRSIIGNQNPLSNGLSQYINGQYALAEYRRAIEEPFAPFVPVSQPDLGHWARGPGLFFPETNQQDVMLATTGFFNDAGELIEPVEIITEITFAAMADLGFAVTGFNEQFAAPPGPGTGRWPKITGPGTDPFALNGIRAAQGVAFRQVNIQRAKRRGPDTAKPEVVEVTNTNRLDPYNLRNLRWTNK